LLRFVFTIPAEKYNENHKTIAPSNLTDGLLRVIASPQTFGNLSAVICFTTDQADDRKNPLQFKDLQNHNQSFGQSSVRGGAESGMRPRQNCCAQQDGPGDAESLGWFS
jgi:hypothetical protein